MTDLIAQTLTHTHAPQSPQTIKSPGCYTRRTGDSFWGFVGEVFTPEWAGEEA